MEKERFLFLLNNYSSLTEDETAEIGKLQDEFPYSQAIHNLVARGAQLNDLNNRQIHLNTAAVYSTDRSVLKALVTASKEERKTAPPALSATTKKPEEKPEKIDTTQEQPEPVIQRKSEVAVVRATTTKPVETRTTTIRATPVDLSGDALVNEVFKDIEKLKKLKHDFEIAADGFGLPEAHAPAVQTEQEGASEKKPETKKVIKKEPTESLIAEIKSTKKKIKPVDPRQKEQLDIIDQFIKSKPSIAKKDKVTSSVAQTDLSEGSAVFSDNIVSETLVEILIKQGKREKAVEVLRKLIWKFPQKKAYFAAQIEELTK